MGSTDTTRKGRHIDPTDYAPELAAFVAESVKESEGWLEFTNVKGERISILLLPTAARQMAFMLRERAVFDE